MRTLVDVLLTMVLAAILGGITGFACGLFGMKTPVWVYTLLSITSVLFVAARRQASRPTYQPRAEDYEDEADRIGGPPIRMPVRD